ncbi:MAG: sigma-54-dependent Fis family transcriptional regulator [Nitrospirae bacterium]|nr:MAG: sigma-54-dependent Fis family transcriptional regulator [Nitrospirota bacterium]
MLIKRAIERRDLYRENLLLKEHLATEEIVGKSTAMQGVMEKVRKVAPTKTTVLLLGESGTGKELIARAIHKLSPRRDKLFVPINCAAIPRELLESELFGYEKGAFTGATSRKPGKFEIANGGTVFLDEISELELSLQAKLLRVLQDQIIERVGGTRPLKVDVRIIAATNADLKKRVQEGKFREDLYYRLNVFPIEIPPLRERKEDIPLLVEHFIKKYAREMKVPPKKVKDRAMKLLMQYEWKGNVRELENTIERAMILAEGDEIGPEHISLVGVDTGEPLGETLTQGVSLEEAVKEVVRRVERRIIKEALERHHWNKTRVAEELQVSYKTLLTKIKEYGLE